MGNQSTSPDQQTLTYCGLCRELRQDVHVNVCLPCVEDTLRRLLPRLADTLEERYGRRLNEWLETGRFTSTFWTLRPRFQISEEKARRFVTEIVADALGEDAIALSLPRSDGWALAPSNELMDAVYERCGEVLRLLITRTLAESLGRLPTRAAERELIETAVGRRPSNTPRRRQAAVEVAAFSSASPLPGPARVLLELRYGTDRRHFTECWEGEIDPVWREVAELLPAEVGALIPGTGTAG